MLDKPVAASDFLGKRVLLRPAAGSGGIDPARQAFDADAKRLVDFAAVLIFVVGAVDDLKEVSAPAKMAGIGSENVRLIAGDETLAMRPEVLALADFVGSTSAILQFARDTKANEIIIGTEKGILTQLTKDNPEKTFIPASDALFCADMKKISLDDIERSLATLQPLITSPWDVRRGATQDLDKMLAHSFTTL